MAIPQPTQQQTFEPQGEAPSPNGEPSGPKKKGWVWFLALTAVACGAYYFYRSRPSAESKAAPAPGARSAGFGTVSVAVAPALMENVPYYLSGLGTVNAFNTVTVKSRVDGQLQKVYFQEGQYVHEGDLLAEIDPRPFQVALEQMEGQLFRDQSQLNDAKIELGRYDQLHKEGVVAQQQVDTQSATVGQQQGAVRADQAQIDNEKLQLAYCKITAPITGRVGLRLVDQGNMIHATDSNGLVVITQVQPIAVLFTLPEDVLPQVIQHMKSGQLAVEAYSRDDQTRIAAGKLLTVDNQIDPTTGTVRLKSVFDNRDLSLWPNQFVNVRLMLDVRKNAIVVPLAAIQRGTQGSYVYTVKNGKANLQNVKVDLTQGDMALIATGVSEGDQVVVDGQERLQTGTPVEVHSSAPNSPGGGSATGASQPGGGTGGGRRPNAGAGFQGAPGRGANSSGPPSRTPQGNPN